MNSDNNFIPIDGENRHESRHDSRHENRNENRNENGYETNINANANANANTFANTKDELKIKKISIFTKMTNSVSKRPRFHLALIIMLVLIIIIILIYYRGILYIGPFCKNNMKSKEITTDDPVTGELINSIAKI